MFACYELSTPANILWNVEGVLNPGKIIPNKLKQKVKGWFWEAEIR